MTLKCNIQGTGASSEHSEAVCGELAPYVTATGSTQATATLLRRQARHIVTAGSGAGVIVPPGIGQGDHLQYGDELEITNAADGSITVYPPLGTAFLGSSVNAGLTLVKNYSVSMLVQSSTQMVPRFYAIASGSGNVSSVGMTVPASIMTVANSPITTSGSLDVSLTTQTSHTAWLGPNGGSPATPTFRALVSGDIPSLPYAPQTSGTSILYGNGSGGFSNATVGSGLTFIAGTLAATASGGTVTSVGLSLPAIITVSGSPVTTTGTLTGVLATQSANTVWAGPNTGAAAAPTFRALVIADLPGNIVTTTGSPANGNLAAFTGGATVSNSNLSGDVTTSGALVATVKANLKLATIFYEINGGGSVIATGLKGYMQINFDCTISANTLLSDTSTTSVVNIWKCTYSAFDVSSHPVAGDKITASAPPTISASVKSTDSTLTGWTTAITAGDILAFNVDSNNNATRLDLSLKISKT